MKVVGADAGVGADVGAIPTAIWEGPTARIVERRNFDRRHARRPEPELATAVVATPAPARNNVIIGISLLTFASGIALATAANRMARSGPDRIAQLERRAPVAPPAPQQAVAPAIIVQPIAKEAPAPVAAVEPAAEPVSTRQPAIAKAAPAPRVVAARVARPRRIGAAVRASDLEADDPFDATPARPARKWVDPFAE